MHITKYWKKLVPKVEFIWKFGTVKRQSSSGTRMLHLISSLLQVKFANDFVTREFYFGCVTQIYNFYEPLGSHSNYNVRINKLESQSAIMAIYSILSTPPNLGAMHHINSFINYSHSHLYHRLDVNMTINQYQLLKHGPK